MLNLPIAMLAYKEGYLFLFVVPWIMAQLLFFPCRSQAVEGRVKLAVAGIESGNNGIAPGGGFIAPGYIIIASAPSPTPELQPSISSPGGGEALQGMVAISGTTDVSGFSRMEIAFAYQTDPTGTWFPLQQSSTQVKDGALASWDTTTITDGTYRLRMQVFLRDGQVLESIVTGLRVRNYSTIETSTPEVRPAGRATSTPTSTPRADFQPAAGNATLLPTNPAQVTSQHLQTSAAQGVMAVLGAALLGILYIGLRAIIRR